MTGNVVTLDAFNATSLPPASEAKIVGAFASDVGVAQMVVKQIGGARHEIACFPLAFDDIFLLRTVHRQERDGRVGVKLGCDGLHGRCGCAAGHGRS